MNELTTTEKKEILPSAQHFLERAKEDMKDVGDRFFMLGCRLYEAQIYHYVEALGYESIEQLAEVELDLGKSSTYNLINVFKRFCDRDQYGNYKTWVKPAFRPYKYSQLVEMEKALCLDVNIEKEIPPSTPVRVLKEYIKYLNKNLGNHKNLPEWKAEQEQTTMLPPVLDSKPIKKEPTDTAPDGSQPDTDVAPTVEQPAETIQTFGQPTCAKPEQTKTVVKLKKEEPIYNLNARDGVRVFLKDYQNWRRYSQSWGSPFFKAVYGYTFKNGKYIMACERKIFDCIKFNIQSTVIEPIYFLSTENGMAEITKSLFEQYCAEHKDEL